MPIVSTPAQWKSQQLPGNLDKMGQKCLKHSSSLCLSIVFLDGQNCIPALVLVDAWKGKRLGVNCVP